MKSNFYIIFFLLNVIISQDNSIRLHAQETARIDQVYERLQERIKKKEIFVSHVKLNSHRLSLHFKSQPSHTERYFYTFQGKQLVLLFVTTYTEVGMLNYYSEYLFDDKSGKLLLYQERQNDKDKFSYRKLKVYFTDMKAIATFQSNEENEDMQNNFDKVNEPKVEEVRKILSSAKYYQEKFYANMDEVLRK
ncbi:MAG: hypothetical protein NZ551_07570 [Microscillaceae bacterium]|nr:hypothetical protein [Microscillaceae bacterium]MDW8461054.1 hypothetical protein [Cytophagales bacterium]